MSGLGGSEAGGLGDAGYGPSGPSDVGGGGMSQADAEAAINAALNAPSNVVSSPESGAWTDASGQGIVSQGMNISLGLDPTHGAIGPYAGIPNTPNRDTLEAVAATLGYSLDDLVKTAALDEWGNLDPKQLSAGLLDYGTLAAALSKDPSLGQLGLTNNQTISEALAAKDVSDAMDKAFPGLANALVPGFGTLSSVSKALVGLHQGYLTPGQALAQIGLGILSAKTNIPEGALQQAFGGQYGPLAGGIAQSGLAGAIGQAIGVPAGLVNMGLGAAGVGKSISGAMPDVKGPDLLGPSLESVGIVTPSAEPSGTAAGDVGGTTLPTATPTSTASTSTSSSSSASPLAGLGLAGLLGGASSDEEKEQADMADIRRGIAMTPYGMPYGG